jgi:hypothetical protein
MDHGRNAYGWSWFRALDDVHRQAKFEPAGHRGDGRKVAGSARAEFRYRSRHDVSAWSERLYWRRNYPPRARLPPAHGNFFSEVPDDGEYRVLVHIAAGRSRSHPATVWTSPVIGLHCVSPLVCLWQSAIDSNPPARKITRCDVATSSLSTPVPSRACSAQRSRVSCQR